MDLAGKTALVTGGSRGIGAATSKRLAREGAHVAVNYSSSPDNARAVVDEIRSTGGNAFVVQGNVASPDAVESMFAELDQRFSEGIDILVNNAGIFELAPITETTLADFDRTMQVNVRGVFDVTRHAVQRMNDHGRIITLGSCMGDRSMFAGSAIYAMSKSAVAGLTKGWAHDLGERGISVTCLQRGPIDTDMNPDVEDNPGAAYVKPLTTLKRFGTAEEVAELIGFLASPGGGYISGQTITIDGGLNA
ncbi:MAG: 3-oxoacyl-ACP reductase family protein [Planctomycetota bacterium]